MIISEHSGAVLVRDLPELGLRAGDYGVVVHVARKAGDPGAASGYLLEVFAADGPTIDVFDVPADAVRPGRPDDVSCVRPVAAE